MKRRMRKNRLSGPLPMRYVLLLTFAFFTIITVIGIWLVNGEIRPTLMQYAEAQTKKIATLVINDAVKSKVAKVDDLDQIMTAMPDQTTGTMQFDTQKINKILSDITSAIQENLHHVEEGELAKLEKLSDVEFSKGADGIVYGVPIGLATKNAFLANMGPRIPIEFSVIGDVETDVKPEIKSYGINNAFVKIIVEAKVHVSILAPFSTKVTTVTTNIPIAMGMIQGDVPGFYNGMFPNVGSSKNAEQ